MGTSGSRNSGLSSLILPTQRSILQSCLSSWAMLPKDKSCHSGALVAVNCDSLQNPLYGREHLFHHVLQLRLGSLPLSEVWGLTTFKSSKVMCSTLYDDFLYHTAKLESRLQGSFPVSVSIIAMLRKLNVL